ncbi:MAG TPA: ferritin-like domain-containing protein [Solirubrobacterales bacterium]|nr:ferritin-like domain-containing protein [Solirubrobacterales bacterium]
MGADPSAGGYDGRRGLGRAAFVSALILVATLVAALGCGPSGHGAETDPEKGSDAAILNRGLARELTLLDAYTRALPLLRGERAAVVRRLRAEQQEYVDDATKAIRGLGGDTEAEADELALAGGAGRAELLDLARELEQGALDFYVGEAAHLHTAAPRTLDAWLAAGHAQHLVLVPGGGG